MRRCRIGFVLTKTLAKELFSQETVDFLASFADFNALSKLPDRITPEYMLEALADADVAVTCWHTPAFTDEMLERLPKLRLVAHAAGSIKNLVPKSFWQNGRRITSNAPVLAEDVAQTTLAHILSGLKRMWEMGNRMRSGGWKPEPGTVLRRPNGLTVGIVGASMAGRTVIEYLRPFHCRVLVSDPFFSALEAKTLGVTKMELDEMLPLCDVVSLHAPANEDCRHMLNARNLPTLKDGCLLINTARGMLIEEPALIRELETGRISACLDVTDPEPSAPDSPLRTLPNVLLQPHLAGGHTQNGRLEMGENIANEIYSYVMKGTLRYDIRNDALLHMA